MKRYLTILYLSLTAFVSHGQTLTIDECVSLACDNYPAVAQYGLLDKMKQFDISNLSKSWLPQGTISTQISWQNNVANLPDALTKMLSQQGMAYPGLDKTQYRLGMEINQKIWDGGKTAANRQAIETNNEVERRSLDVRIYEVEGQVEEIYFALLLLDARIDRIEKTTTLVDSTLRQIKSMYQNGVAMQSDCDQVEAKLLTLRQNKSQLTATRESYRRVMEIFIGQPIGNRKLVLPSENPEFADNHPQLTLFNSRIKNIASRETALKAEIRPHIGGFASGYYGYPGYDMFRNMQSRDLSFNFMIGLKISWNFSSLYTNRTSLDKLYLQRRQIETDRETFLFNNSIAEKESLGQIAGLREIMRDDERIVELRASVMRASQSQLRSGVIDATSLLTKITDEELAENDLILHRIELIKAIYQLKHIRNK